MRNGSPSETARRKAQPSFRETTSATQMTTILLHLYLSGASCNQKSLALSWTTTKADHVWMTLLRSSLTRLHRRNYTALPHVSLNPLAPWRALSHLTFSSVPVDLHYQVHLGSYHHVKFRRAAPSLPHLACTNNSGSKGGVLIVAVYG